jgi:pimeloyl-ACP methyl ester carboxylesterase
MGLGIATRNKTPVAEIYFGGAGDSYSQLVASYAAARARVFAGPKHAVHYFTHRQALAARNQAETSFARGFTLVLIGHSWGADVALGVSAQIAADVALLVGIDPVGRSLRIKPTRPGNVARLIHVDALPNTPDRSDIVKSIGRLIGGVPRAYRDAEIQIPTRFNHAEFAAMMRCKGGDGRSAADHIAAVHHHAHAGVASTSIF